MRNAYEVLKERGFIEQLTHEDEIKELFAKGALRFISVSTRRRTACMSATS